MSSSGKWSKGQGGKLQKKRRIVSPVVSPEYNQVDEKVGDVLTDYGQLCTKRDSD